MRLSEDVIRYLTVKQDGPMPPPRVLPNQAETTPVTETATEAESD
jgi:small subunit ribosomal protein S6